MASPISKRESIAYSVIRCVEGAWRRGELVDLIVAVDTHEFDCHSFILGACSGYFRSIFKSGYATKRHFITLSDISVEVFELILTAIYSGADILNKDTHSDVWKAAHKLEIGFLVRECERFAMWNLNLESYSDIYLMAKQFQTSNVLTITRDFIAKNFYSLKNSDLLIQLSGDELLGILKHPNLVVKTEDHVMEAVLKWVSYKFSSQAQNTTSSVSDMNQTMLRNATGEILDSTNLLAIAENKAYDISLLKIKDKEIDDSCNKIESDIHSIKNNVLKSDDANTGSKLAPTVETVDEMTCGSDTGHIKRTSEYLILLLMTTRTCLLSTHCISLAYMNKYVASNPLAREIIFRAALYHTGHKDHGQWPTAAVHRKYSPFENVGIFLRNDGVLEAFSFATNNCFINVMYHQIAVLEAQLTVFDQELYAAGLDNTKDANVTLFALKGLRWVKLCEFPKVSSLGFKTEMNFSFQPPYIPPIVKHSIMNHGQRRSLASRVRLAKSPVAFVKSSPSQPTSSSGPFSFGSSPSSTVAPISFPSITSVSNAIHQKITNTLGLNKPMLNSPLNTLDSSSFNSQSTKENQTAIPVTTNAGLFPIKMSTPPPSIFTTQPSSSFTIPPSSSFATPPSSSFTIPPSSSFTTPPSSSFTIPASGIFTASSTSPNPSVLEAAPEKTGFNIKSPADQASGILYRNKIAAGRTKPAASLEVDWVPGSFHIISHGKFIYYMNSITCLMFKVNPCFPEEIFELKYFLANEKAEFVSGFDDLLLVFCSAVAEVNKTIIYSFDTNTEEATKLTTLDGPAHGLVTFQDDDNKYMLQSNGALWTITRDITIHFGFLIKLWDFDYQLNGGVFYNGELFLHGDDPINFNKTEPKYPEIFARIHVNGQSEKCSRFLPFIILKKGWIPKED